MRLVTGFDDSVIGFLNAYRPQMPALDVFMGQIWNLNLLKGGVLMALVWWIWFDEKQDQGKNRACVISTVVGACGAMLTTRVLGKILPFRDRPINDPELYFAPPVGLEPGVLEVSSSFPSDHAALFFSLAFGLFLASRPLGVVAILHTSLVISFPRVYLGLHFPSDILGGAVIAAVMLALARTRPIKRMTIPPTLKFSERHPAAFYTGFMLFSAQLIVLFNDARDIARMIYGPLIRLFSE